MERVYPNAWKSKSQGALRANPKQISHTARDEPGGSLLDRVIGELQGRGKLTEKRASNGDFIAWCVYHADGEGKAPHDPNLHVGPRGFYCHACEKNGGLRELAQFLGVDDTPGIAVVYPYRDEENRVLYEVLRYEDRTFKQRRPNGSGGYVGNLKGIRKVLYNLPELLARPADLVFVVEGEKDANRLMDGGILATTNSGGAASASTRSAGKWQEAYSKTLQGREVCILFDNDKAGRLHAATVSKSLEGMAASVKIVRLPELGEQEDVSDWLDAGNTIEELLKQVAEDPGASVADLLAESKRVGEAAGETGALPGIETNRRELKDTTSDALMALIQGNTPPSVWIRGGRLVRLHPDEDNRIAVEALTIPTLRNVLAQRASWVSTSKKRGVVPVAPPHTVVENVLAEVAWPGIPRLVGMVTAPIVAPSGDIITTPGYHEATGFYYHTNESLELPEVELTQKNVEGAKRLLLTEMLGEFPFVDEASKAHALALLILPFVRLLIDGPTPFHLIDAPTTGTGKTLLADAVTLPFKPEGAAAMSAGRDEDEWRKRITSVLAKAPSHILIDNVSRKLYGSALESAITATLWEDRILGQTATITLPVRCAWIGTGNNVEMSDEMARRSVWCRIDARVERPGLRDNFKVPILRAWTKQYRPQIVAAALTLVRAWLAEKRPAYTEKRLGSFESWAEIIGGILGVAGVEGFLGNAEELYERRDPDREAWLGFLTAWYSLHGGEPIGVNDLHTLATEKDLLGEALGEGTERAQRTRLGKLLRRKESKTCGPYRMEFARIRHQARQYRVVQEGVLG